MHRVCPATRRSLLLALVFGAALAACSGGGSSATPPGVAPTATPVPTDTPTPTPVPTPTPSPQIASNSTYFSPLPTPATLGFTGPSQTATITVTEPGYSTFTLAAVSGSQINGTGCSGAIVANVSAHTGTSFTFTSSASTNACGSQAYTVTDSSLTDTLLIVELTQTDVGIQGKQRRH
jgi:hypothetical protein